MVKKLLLAIIFIVTVLLIGTYHSIYAQQNAVDVDTLSQEQIQKINKVNSEKELPEDTSFITLIYTRHNCRIPETTEEQTKKFEPNTISETTLTPPSTSITTVITAQVKQNLPQTGTQKSVSILGVSGLLIILAFLMIKYHKKKVWMILLITASATSLYNLRNVMAQSETIITSPPFVLTKEYCLVGYINHKSETTTSTEATKKGTPLVQPELREFKGDLSTNGVDEDGNIIAPPIVHLPEFSGGISGIPEVCDFPEFKGNLSNNGVDENGNTIAPPIIHLPEYTISTEPTMNSNQNPQQ